ncbi:MAG: hypothetical protein A3K03_11870 [Bdellovibrionales bacterium RIFOXYD1_FULL_44_7]|nr:MAG: hypothetical protein A3K03_11870 [Bdellovibrionales bacterium RIFOXYD1_FULL_44_7]
MNISSPSSNSQDFELNLASIIDCLTVLITFLLASASFISIGILDAGVAAAGVEASSVKPPPVNVAIEIKKDKSFRVKVTGKESRTVTVDGNKEQLQKELQAIKGRWSSLNAVTVLADSDIEYQDVVQTMEAARKVLPAVLLGGF